MILSTIFNKMLLTNVFNKFVLAEKEETIPANTSLIIPKESKIHVTMTITKYSSWKAWQYVYQNQGFYIMSPTGTTFATKEYTLEWFIEKNTTVKYNDELYTCERGVSNISVEEGVIKPVDENNTLLCKPLDKNRNVRLETLNMNANLKNSQLVEILLKENNGFEIKNNNISIKDLESVLQVDYVGENDAKEFKRSRILFQNDAQKDEFLNSKIYIFPIKLDWLKKASTYDKDDIFKHKFAFEVVDDCKVSFKTSEKISDKVFRDADKKAEEKKKKKAEEKKKRDEEKKKKHDEQKKKHDEQNKPKEPKIIYKSVSEEESSSIQESSLEEVVEEGVEVEEGKKILGLTRNQLIMIGVLGGILVLFLIVVFFLALSSPRKDIHSEVLRN